MYRYECDFDDTVFEGPKDHVKEQAKEHLSQHHRDEVEERFRSNHTGNDCLKCDYHFPIHADEHPGLECPKCGHDHLSWYTAQIVKYMLKKSDCDRGLNPPRRPQSDSHQS